MRRHHPSPSSPSPAPGFTLVELLVAIAIISFLMVGVGQIFKSVSELVSGGTAAAEVEQMARAIERQMRDDFASLNAMSSDQTFIAIRMRELGDVNRNKTLDTDETAVYISQADRDADDRDIADGLFDNPYEPGSRAVTVRLDEIMFLGMFIGREAAYQSFEQMKHDRPDTLRPDIARIYYGQALRPPRDPNWPPAADASNPPRVPQRIFLPDGDFGQRRGDKNRFVTDLAAAYTDAMDFTDTTGRNEYAGDFILARQALLLAGGNAAGNVTTRNGDSSALTPAQFGDEREYAPYIRDLETLSRFWGVGGQGPYNFQLDHQGPRSGVYDGRNISGTFPPAPRLIQHGRVDICAQDRNDVQRWLEGEPWPTNGITPVSLTRDPKQQANAFNAGRFSLGAERDGYQNGQFSSTFDDDTDSPRAMLWQQPDPKVNLSLAYTGVRRGIRAAIAGAFTRLLVDDEPPFIDRSRDRGPSSITYPIDNIEAPSDAEDAYMDQHAVLATQCSNFEIAWRYASPDWPRAEKDIDVNGDSIPEFRTGDRIWIDITPLDPNNPDQTRSTVQYWTNHLDQAGASPGFGPIPASGGFDPIADGSTQPEIGYADWRNPPGQVLGRTFRRAVAQNPTQTDNSDIFIPLYNPDISMGAPAGADEYLAVWPFHPPAATGDGYDPAPFPKRLQIRVRMTLHDKQNRIPGGRKFEFIFNVSPGADQ